MVSRRRGAPVVRNNYVRARVATSVLMVQSTRHGFATPGIFGAPLCLLLREFRQSLYIASQGFFDGLRVSLCSFRWFCLQSC